MASPTDTANDWRRVWARRQRGEASSALQALIDLDGFDGGAGRIEEPAWRSYVQRIARDLGMQPGQSVFEIGCGAGAFLLPLHESGMVVSGIDWSASLVAAARAAMPAGDFREADAGSFAAPPRSQDFVVANSVFHYFTDTGYAVRVLEAMLAAADRGVAVLEVPDAASRDAAEGLRRGMMPLRDYEAKYAGLHHQYFERDLFRTVADRNGFDAELSSQEIAGYAQNPYRFNCLMRRRAKP